MNSGLKERLLAIPSVIGLEPTYLTTKSGKWLVIVKKTRKDQSRTDIDKTINDTIFPDSQIEQPGHSNHHNIDFVLVYYTAALQREQSLRPSNSTIYHSMQSNTTSVPHMMSTISIPFQTSEVKKETYHKEKQAIYIRPPPILPLPSPMKNPPSYLISPTTTFSRCSKLTIIPSKKISNPPLKKKSLNNYD